jgi:hypothetical protein
VFAHGPRLRARSRLVAGPLAECQALCQAEKGGAEHKPIQGPQRPHGTEEGVSVRHVTPLVGPIGHGDGVAWP